MICTRFDARAMLCLHFQKGHGTDTKGDVAMNHAKCSRRAAIGSLATGLSAGFFTGVAARPSMAANEKLQIACIGVANRASANLKGVSSQAIVAVCDIDDVYLDRITTARGKGKTPPILPKARQYHDYREMIEKEVGRVDAVVVSTADHHHVPASIRAIRKGMHVYCEKPLSHTVAEARLVAQEAERMGVATQLGTQIHAGDNYRRVVEVIRSGAIGDIGEVHVWVGKGWGGGDLPVKSVEPPASLHWDLWLGPAHVRPFAPKVYHPAQWRRWWDFGNGTLGDMGCHFMDLPFWALDLKTPVRCKAEGPPLHPETCPTGLVVHYDFPSRGNMPPVHLTWYDGSMTPEEVKGQKVPKSGVMFVGTEGMMFANYGSYQLYPEDKFADFKAPPQSIPKSIGHYEEWIKACRDGSTTTCNFGYSGPLSESVLLGMVAYRTGKQLEWDAKNLVATNAPEASTFISKQYRSGWDVA